MAAAFRLMHQLGDFRPHTFSGKRHCCQQADGLTWGCLQVPSDVLQAFTHLPQIERTL